ncbi:MAG TPA: DUF1501 domain-containing protein [Cyclobacteriaceae bacterium]|nr:DUF1501 domain-containing protein [Cyclobacteriaceae bacterium]
MNRREFIKRSAITTGAVLAGGTLPEFNSRRIIIIRLLGGNDGLNTVVPYRDDLYYQARPTLALHAHSLIRVSSTHGLHPALEPLLPIWDQGFVTVLNHVGFPEPEPTHHKAILNWQTGTPTGREGKRWAERYGMTSPLADLESAESIDLNCESPRSVNANHSVNAFAQQLRYIARTIQSGSSNLFYQASLSGFDTHVEQGPQQAAMLKTFASSVNALITDLQATGHFRETVIFCYSEFGRSLNENKLGGTHHGAGNCVFLFGEKLRAPGIYNETRVSVTAHGGIPVTIDYRRVYMGLLDQWLGNSKVSLFEPLALF